MLNTITFSPPTAILHVTPVPAPRQSGRDAWRPRPCVVRYRRYRDDIKKLWGDRPLILPCKLTFILPMPGSWGQKKRAAHDGQPHLQKPDVDNLLKAFIDSLYRDQDDSHVYSIWSEKRWGDEGLIIVQEITILGDPPLPPQLAEGQGDRPSSRAIALKAEPSAGRIWLRKDFYRVPCRVATDHGDSMSVPTLLSSRAYWLRL